MINSRVVTTGHLRLITGGDLDAAPPWQDTAHTAAAASVPEAFMTVCRCLTALPQDVEVCGMTVTVIPSRRVTNDPGADLAAWETFHRIILAATAEARGDIGHERHSLPPQITAACWRTPDGRDLRITGACSPFGWMAHWFSRTGGDAAG